MASLIRSTGVVALSTLISRILGFVREVLFANFFGASGSTDAFFIAFRIPNLLRRLVAEGALTISFIPIYTEYRMKEGDEQSLALAQKTLSLLMLITAFFVVLGIIFSPVIVKLFAYGIDNTDIITLAVFLNRIMFPFLLAAAFVAFSMGVLNSHGFFFAPAFAPVTLNIGIIIGIMYFSSFFQVPLYGVALGVLLGGVIQIILQVPYLMRSGFKMKISFDIYHPGIQRIFKMIVPALFGIAVYQINILMSTILASMLAPGSISYLYYSDRLNEIVLGIFIVSIGNVVLPEMSRMTAVEDFDKLKQLFISAARASLFLAIPSSAALMIIGYPIISVLFMRGEFTPHDVQMTYNALLYASMGIASISILRITTPVFYSLKDTKRPVIVAAISFVLNFAMGFFLMNTSLQHAGLALANTLSVTVQMALLLMLLEKQIGKIEKHKIIIPLLKYSTAAVIMVVPLVLISGKIDWIREGLFIRAGAVALMVVAGMIIYTLMCWILQVDELKYLITRLKQRIQKKQKLQK